MQQQAHKSQGQQQREERITISTISTISSSNLIDGGNRWQLIATKRHQRQDLNTDNDSDTYAAPNVQGSGAISSTFHASSKSKSATLDSGIQSCDLDANTASSSFSSCASSGESSASPVESSPIERSQLLSLASGAARVPKLDSLIEQQAQDRQRIAKIAAASEHLSKQAASANTQLGRSWRQLEQRRSRLDHGGSCGQRIDNGTALADAASELRLARSVSLRARSGAGGRSSSHGSDQRRRVWQAQTHAQAAAAATATTTAPATIKESDDRAQFDCNNNTNSNYNNRLGGGAQVDHNVTEASSKSPTHWASPTTLSSLFRSKSLRVVARGSERSLWDTFRKAHPQRDSTDQREDGDYHQHDNQHHYGDCARSDDDNAAKTPATTRRAPAKALSSMLRASIRTRNQNCDQVDSGATIDYLVDAQQRQARLTRASSVGSGLRRRASSQQPGARRTGGQVSSAGAGGSSYDATRHDDESNLAGARSRIAHFLRRLFSVRRSRPSQSSSSLVRDSGRADTCARCHSCQRPSSAAQSTSGPAAGDTGAKGQLIAHVGLHQCCATVTNRLVMQQLPKTTANASTSSTSRRSTGAKTARSSQLVQVLSPASIESSSDSDSSSSSAASSRRRNSSSLFEILDCSRAIDEATRRTLREEQVRPVGASRATWRALEANKPASTANYPKRSDSSLSHRSDNSCSTQHSTVSQQLRRHLDKACGANRKSCTSQREREFIDSIHVLRQASRHAMQKGSRSSSKSRHASKSTSAKDELSSLSPTTTIACDDINNELHRINRCAERPTGTQPSRQRDLNNHHGATDKEHPSNWLLAKSSGGAHNNNNTNFDAQCHASNCCCWCASAIAAASCCLGGGAGSVNATNPTASNDLYAIATCNGRHSAAASHLQHQPQVSATDSALAPCCLALQRATVALMSTGLPPLPLPFPLASFAQHNCASNNINSNGNNGNLNRDQNDASNPMAYCPFYHAPQLMQLPQQQQSHHYEENKLPPVESCRLSPTISLATLKANSNQQLGHQQHHTSTMNQATSLATLPITTSMQSIALQSEQHQQHQHNTTIDLRIEINGAELTGRKSAGGGSSSVQRCVTPVVVSASGLGSGGSADSAGASCRVAQVECSTTTATGESAPVAVLISSTTKTRDDNDIGPIDNGQAGPGDRTDSDLDDDRLNTAALTIDSLECSNGPQDTTGSQDLLPVTPLGY